MRISKSLQYANVYREDGTILGPAVEHIPREWLEIYQSQVRHSNPLTKDAFWVECPVCGLRGTDLSNHVHCSLKAPMVYTGTCIKCGQTYTIDRESRFRENCLCGKCSMVENQAKTKAIRIENETDEDRENRRIRQAQKLKQTLLERYGCESVMSNPEFAKKNKENRRKSMYKKYGVYSNLQLPEVKKKARDGRKQFLENAGVTSIVQLPGVRERITSTNIERYGHAFPLQSKEVRTKCAETLYALYGEYIPSKVQEIYQRIEETMLLRYGVKHVFNIPENREKAIEASKHYWQENFQTTSGFGVKEIQEKAQKSSKETLLRKYKVSSPFLIPGVKAKLKAYFQEKYGCDNPLQSKEVRQKIAKSRKFPKTEQTILEMLSNRGIPFIHQILIENHTFDFAILDKDLENIKLLVDIDGLYWHNYYAEANGITLHETYTYDAMRPTYCKDIPFICIFDNDIEFGFRQILQALEMDYDEYIKDVFDWCKNQEFPYPTYDDDILHKSWTHLCETTVRSINSQIGYKLIRHFHPSIYHASKEGYESPFNAYHNDELLMKAVKNRFIYKHSMEPARILDGLSIAKIAPKVSIFQPSYAKYLITKYLNQVNTIFDPFSGFSGRMLGTIATGKQYIGQDCNEITVSESRALANFLGIEPQLTCTDSTNSAGEYEALFTCPPYNLKETWGQDIQDLSCDEWINLCMKNFKCKHYLFVVDKTEKYQQYVVETKTNRSHLNSGTPEQVVFISCV